MKFSFARFSGFLEYFLITRRKLFSLSIAKLPFTSGRLESKGTPPWKPRNYWLLSALNKTEKGKNHINKNVPPTTQTRNNATFNTLQLSSLSEWDLFPLQGAVSLFLHPKRITLQHFVSCYHISQSIKSSNLQTCLPVLSAFHSTAFPISWKIHLVSWYHFWKKSKKSSYNIESSSISQYSDNLAKKYIF